MSKFGIGRQILLVESHPALRMDLSRALERLGFSVLAFGSADDARDVVDGARAVERIRRGRFAIQVIDLCAAGSKEWLAVPGYVGMTIVTVSDPAMLRDCSGLSGPEIEILYKPFSIRMLESRILAREKSQQSSRLDALDPILNTREPELLQTLARARRLARREIPIAIDGELGTGRRALAESIHAWSTRAGQPFRCLERSELATVGSAQIAQTIDDVIASTVRGTLAVLDPADFPAAMQDALILAMRRVEDEGPRWLTIVKCPLEQSVREGRLSLELQYRLDSARLNMPPFRRRKLDQLEICASTARRVALELGEPTPKINSTLVEMLARDGFPGNRLGLESRLRSGLVRSDGDPRRILSLLGDECSRDRDRVRAHEEVKPLASLHLKTLERDTIVRALAHWDGNRTRASEALGISIRTLRNKIRDYGLR